MIRLDLPLGLEGALTECRRRGLVIQSERELAGRPSSRHLHLRFPDRAGTIEFSEAGGRAWVQVHSGRDGGWAGDLARELASHDGSGPSSSASSSSEDGLRLGP